LSDEWLERLAGETRRIPGNNPLLLSDPGVVWIVRSGSMALFAVAVERGEPAGTRRHLFTVSSGDGLFGVPAGSERCRALLAVSLEETELVRVEAHGLARLAGSGESRAAELFSSWMRKLDSALAGAGHILAPGLDDMAAIPEKIAQLHLEFLKHIDDLDRRDEAKLALRLKEREQLFERATCEVLGELAGVVRPDLQRPAARWDTPLIAAAQAVGQAAGIEIRPPKALDAGAELRDGLRALERSSRIRTRRVVLTGKWWKRDSGPLLACTLQGGRPVALLPRGPRRYVLFDPAAGKHVRVGRSVASSLQPFAHVFYRPLPDKVAKPWEILAFGLKGTHRDVAAILMAALAGTLLGMFTPIATSVLIDSAIPDSDQSLLLQLGVGLLGAALGKTAFDLSQGFATTRVSTASIAAMQAAVWDRLLKLRPSFLRQYSTGDLASRATAISTIHRRLSATTLRTLFSSLVSVLNLGLMLYYSMQLALIGVVAALMTVLITLASGRAMLQRLRPLQQMEGKILGLTVQLINGVSKLRVSGAERFAFAYWGKRYSEQQRLVLSIQRLQDRIGSINQTVPTLASAWIFLVAGAVFLGGKTAAAGGLSAGIFLAFNAAFGAFIGGMASLSNTVVETLDDFNLWQRAKPILSAEPESDPGKADPGVLAGRIAMDHVTFRYRDSGPLTLEDVSFHAAPGEFVAFVGPSGSGKSTVFRLLLGFELPQSGTVYFDGQDLNGLDLFALRRQLGVVLQNSNLLSGSIFENIAAGAAITLDQAWEAARQAGIAQDIAALPMGMHTFISEGATNISVGQRQRLLIARALVFRPRILLFDEATSALDNRAQAIVSESLERLQVTRVVIAHRLSTIRSADRIYVIEHGRVVQQGSFAELASQDGLFARMMSRQML